MLLYQKLWNFISSSNYYNFFQWIMKKITKFLYDIIRKIYYHKIVHKENWKGWDEDDKTNYEGRIVFRRKIRTSY